MATKRSADGLESGDQNISSIETKRIRLSPTMDLGSNSSNPSTCSISETSALRSSPHTSERTRQSSISSFESSGDADSESYLSSSSSEESSDDEPAEAIVTVGGPKRPHFNKSAALDGAQDLQARLAALLPRLQAANEELGDGEHGWNMEDVEDGEQHIEMDLGLGVLEEQQDGDSDSSDETSESNDESGASDFEDASPVPGPTSSGAARRDKDVMGKLMGQRRDLQKPQIEDLD